MNHVRAPIRLGLSGCAGGLESISDRGLLDLARLGDDLGFEGLWLNEEHFQGGHTPEEGRRCLSPLILAAALAAVTTRIRIGFSLLVLPLHHPIMLAEQLASLDVLTEGRIDIGISRGVQPQYRAAFGLGEAGAQVRFETGFDLLRRALGEEPVEIDGRRLRVEPKPVQRPWPPIYFGTYSADAAAWAARQGLRLICHGINSRAELRPVIAAFRDAGGDMDNLPLGRFVHVAETDAEAEAQVWPAVVRLTARMRQARLFERPHIITEAELEPRRYLDEMVIAGSAETVAQKIRWLCAEFGVRYVNALPAFFGHLPEPLLRRSLTLLGREVRPRLSHAPTQQISGPMVPAQGPG